jgi:catechol 2,3-dioxygenase-like lactoylglutathione lyase family enzyme
MGPIGGMTTTKGLRRFAVRDPFCGIIVEVWEDGAGLPVAQPPRDYDYDPLILYVTHSVSDIEAARRYYSEILRLPLKPLETLHAEADEALWGLPGATRKGFVVDGGDGLLEVVEYVTPRGRPKRDGWRLSDQGIMNVAFVGASIEAIQGVIDRLDAEGNSPGWLIRGPGVLGTYVTQRDREVEMLHCPDEFGKALGYEPLGPFGGSDMIQMVQRDLPKS